MGSIFEYITDEALISDDKEYYKKCQICGKRDCELYKAVGYKITLKTWC